MPKIEAANIEEHVRIQTDRILNAAGDLFRDRGYRGTDMGDIARSIGLARNSLYRYYASKDHILLACMQREMTPFVERLTALERDHDDAVERIDAWLDLQMDMATGPCQTMINLIGNVDDASPELRSEIGAVHEPPRRVLAGAVREVLADSGRDVELVTGMITSMVQSAGNRIIDGGAAKRPAQRARQHGDLPAGDVHRNVDRQRHMVPIARGTADGDRGCRIDHTRW